MTLDEYLEQEASIRAGCHYHRGVWWKRNSFGACSPLYPLQEIVPGASRPRRLHSIIRYHHVTPVVGLHLDSEIRRRSRNRMMLTEEGLLDFSFATLADRKRRQAINRAVRNGVSVARIENIETVCADLFEIYQSNADRSGHGLTAEWYRKNYSKWWMGVLQEYSLPGRDWFGAFVEKKLVAFLYACIIDNTAAWLVAKSNKNFLKIDPNDLLWAEVIKYYQDHTVCKDIDTGWSIPIPQSIDWRKRSLGFQSIRKPIFDWVNPPVSWTLTASFWCFKPLLDSSFQADRKRGLLFFARTIRSDFNDLK